MSEKRFIDEVRCPICLTLGQMRFQHGNYRCDICDRCWSYEYLNKFIQAFELGRKFEREEGFKPKIQQFERDGSE